MENNDSLTDRFKDRFRSIFFGVVDIVSLIDTDYNIIMVNKAYERLVTKPADECIGEKCYAIIRNRQTPCEDCPILPAKIGNPCAESLVVSIGHEQISLTRQPIYDDRGVIQGVFEIGRIITRELKMEQELQHHERLKIMGKLAACITHEIKNPLASIGLMTISVMERLPKNDLIYQDLESILHEVQRLEIFLENLGDFARPSSFVLRNTSIYYPIDNTLKLLNEKLRSGRIKVKKIYNREIQKIMIDPSKMQQVFFNLFLNSIAAMPNGGELIIKTEVVAEESDNRSHHQVQIRIQDNGTGIKEEDFPYIFDPFFSKSAEGTGLGLSIVSKIIDLHKGSITIQSQAGKGTIVTINIPLDSTNSPLGLTNGH